jgi:hypothetical protein
VRPAAGAFAPFDLTYLPALNSQGVVALRPAEVARLFPGAKLSDQYHLALGSVLAQLVDCDLAAADPPPFADLEQCVVHMTLTATFPDPPRQGAFQWGAGTPCYLRTTKAFDWASRVKKWFPKAAQARHAGRDYFRTPNRLSAKDQLAVFIPDDRTAVFGDEGQVRELIERLQGGRPALTPPPGWDEVSRDLLALAFDQRQARCVRGKWPEGPREVKGVRTLVESVEVLAVGVTLGERSAARVIATARDEASAGEAAKALGRLAGAARGLLLAGPKGGAAGRLCGLLADTLKEGKCGPEGRTVRLHLGAPGGLVEVIAEAVNGAAGAGPPPPVRR